jgi:hypothetical protein
MRMVWMHFEDSSWEVGTEGTACEGSCSQQGEYYSTAHEDTTHAAVETRTVDEDKEAVA